ncbi:MAG TPA: 3-deoxy-D-manno-octulosonic acid transferase, partial [Kiloniellales bacterium]|nr:3-deoxy-D-manno-octulosonic acid transferase [Kiloniellales bacterium]
MASFAADAPLRLYGLAGRAAGPLARWYLDARASQGKEDPARIGERLGRAGLPRPEGPLVWLHGASVGESLSALPLIERLRESRPALAILVTTGTVTSARIMAERLPAGVLHQYAPLDLPVAVDRFLGHWRPDLGLILESELWPNLLARARVGGCELVLLNARMSARSARHWARLRPLIRHLLGHFSMILAQTKEDAARLAGLSAVEPLAPGNLKAAAPPLEADPAELAALSKALADRPRWLAASTHSGEEGSVAAVHEALAPSRPGLLTLIVPRHPHRGPEIAAGLLRAGYRVARRGAGEMPGAETEIYLADTIGELGLWYRLTGIAFVGGSLVPHGGQNLLEPARLGCAVLCGPHVGNFRTLAEEMRAA